MDFISSKAISIGVGILITIIITTGVIYSITQVVNIYSKVYNTDTSIKGKYDEFDKFENGDFNTLEVYNVLKKYYGKQIDKKNNIEVLKPIDERVEKIVLNSKSLSELRAQKTNMTLKWKSELKKNKNGTVIITFTIVTSN